MPESAILAILAGDQTDKLVAEALGDCIYAEPYQPGASLFFRHTFFKSLSGVHQFVDALGNPISNAEIEIMIGRSTSLADKSTKVLIEKTRLDGQGQLRSLKLISTFREFSFLLRHPDYGPDTMLVESPVGLLISIFKHTVQALAKDKWCVFKDAFGNPVPQADVAIFSSAIWLRDKNKLMETIKLDDNSRLKPPASDVKLQNSCFIVSHPDYGIALAEPRRFDYSQGPLAECIVPLIRKDAQERSGSIWGIVLDSQGNPVPSAIMTLYGMEFAGGGRISLDVLERQQLRTITNQQGQFNFCIPVSMSEGQLPQFAKGVKYFVNVEAPKVLRLPNYHGDVLSGRESTILMRSKFLEPREFVIEDEFGPVTDPNMLQLVKYKFYGEDKQGSGLLSTWLRRAEFEQGTYYITATWNNKFYTFEPLILTADSPDIIVLKPVKIEPFGTIYRGRVIHGVTGQPISDALVMALPDFSDFNIDDDDMLMHEAIHQIGPEFGFDDPLFALLKEEFKSSMISVTDAGGNFQIVLNKDQMKPWRHIIATKQDFMGAKQQLVLHSREEASGSGLKDLFTPDEQGYVTIPPLKIFPAGMIIIEPIVPDKFIEELNQSTANQWRPRGTLSWFKFGHERPPWFEAMGDYTHPSRNNGASLFYKRDLLLNAEQKVYVASELEITFRVNVLEERGRGELEPIVIPNIKLRQGEVLNIGRVEFGSALQVAVKVVDSKGRGVEGVTVRHKDEAGLGGSEGITAADGIALLNIPRYSRGEFFVQNRFEYMPDDLFQKPLAEGISYIVGGEEDAGRVFILPLSDNFLALLFN